MKSGSCKYITLVVGYRLTVVECSKKSGCNLRFLLTRFLQFFDLDQAGVAGEGPGR